MQTDTNSNRNVIVAIHGVGAPALGDIISEVSSLYPNATFRRNDFKIGGTPFVELVCEDGLRRDLIEVNWSDIKRPSPTIPGVAEWLIALSFALLHATLARGKVMLASQKMHGVLWETALLWVLFPVLLGLMHANLKQHALALAISDLAVIGLAILTLRATSRTTELARRAGKIAVVSLIALAGVLAVWPKSIGIVNPVAVRVYGLAQIAAAVLIAITAAEVVVLRARKKLTMHGALTGLAFSYLPLAMLSALGSCIWAVSLNLVRLRHPSEIDPEWQAMFLRYLGYDLRSVEWAMAGVTAVLGLYVVGAVLIYRLTNPANQGSVAHTAILGAVILTPVLLLVPGALLVLTSPYFGKLLNWTSPQTVLRIYTVSALRILPWLLAGVTPAATFLDVLADVVFYITDKNLGLSSFKACNERLQKLLNDREKMNSRSVHVVAHSQGSVIAHTVLPELKGSISFVLTTMGCPLSTLYRKYLDWDVYELPDWKNLYRTGDYIGGAVNIPDVDVNIGPGGHTGYWQSEGLLKRLDECSHKRGTG